jgi:hypothetical protein
MLKQRLAGFKVLAAFRLRKNKSFGGGKRNGPDKRIPTKFVGISRRKFA